jgi:anti-anti-sigma factor
MLITEGLDVELEHVGTGILVTLAGTLDKRSVPSLAEALTWPEGSRTPRLYLDLDAVNTIDVTGLRLIDNLCQNSACVVRESAAMSCLETLVA